MLTYGTSGGLSVVAMRGVLTHGDSEYSSKLLHVGAEISHRAVEIGSDLRLFHTKRALFGVSDQALEFFVSLHGKSSWLVEIDIELYSVFITSLYKRLHILTASLIALGARGIEGVGREL